MANQDNRFKERPATLDEIREMYGEMEYVAHDPERYRTTNQTYGTAWNLSDTFKKSYTQDPQYKSFMDTRKAPGPDFGKEPRYEGRPCSIQALSNVPTNTRGQFTNVGRDFHSTSQGLWSNAQFNTPGATLANNEATYSNLQGGWGRVGPSTYDSVHGNGAWVNQWGARSAEPATLRSLRDHQNVDPRDDWVPMDNVPQNQSYQPRP